MRRRFRRIIVFLAACILLTALLGQCYVSLNQRGETAELARAGEITLGRLETDVSPDVYLPHATLSDNAADHYVRALNAYNARRRVPREKSAAVVEEPPIADVELREIVLGSRCRDCDFYDRPEGTALAFIQRDGKPWKFEIASDPYDVRPYIPAMRMLSQVALREGKRNERKRAWKWAEAIYLATMRMANHLRQKPGSVMDVELSLEIERQAAHYLDVFYRVTGDTSRRKLCWRYGDSLNRLAEAVRRKFRQLGILEAAREIALNDRDRVWRIEAIAAIKTAQTDPKLDWWRRRRGEALMESLSHDPDPAVARAATRALSLGGDTGVEERHEPLGSKHREAPTQL